MFTSCHPHKTLKDQALIGHINFNALVEYLVTKDKGTKHCFAYIEGRDRPFDSYEVLGMLKSTRLYSQKYWPIYCFIYENRIKEFISFLHQYEYGIVERWNIIIKPLKETIDSREKLNKFMVEELLFLLGDEHEWVTIIQPDSGLIKAGWEEYVESINAPFLAAPWRHNAALVYNQGNEWYKFNNDYVNVGNGGFSARRIEDCKKAANILKGVKLAELGNPNLDYPPEDLRFGYTLYSLLGYKKPTVEQCNTFSLDPINLQQYKDKVSFGFHCPIL